MDSNNFQRGRYIYATETNALMALINAECARRNKTNPPNGSDWQDVSRGDKILVEHGQKLYTPIKNINVNAPAAPEQQAYISLASLWAWYENIHKGYEGYTPGSSMCSGACTGFCTGCAGTCQTGCETGCKNGCLNSCSGCKDSCAGGCYGGCKNSCDTCGTGCGLDCSGGCKQGCKDNPGCIGK